jgi:hypothetical protein
LTTLIKGAIEYLLLFFVDVIFDTLGCKELLYGGDYVTAVEFNMTSEAVYEGV